ncbi:uncharacterized protein Z519_08867 [Cladophialophora bantiana CBS 173.52]|uniref:Uncharacterized protein n=1 Tax=Cladophialophora bantiana (strain ATCC 10958 / CBS 173.52 / CDC B-1940 / NIH 8579) TaxID=1442370 RepID=A0A0D2HAC8_CLAB1|nr:uncharacterized protein Z519_08867 [Cladophialophora bantiana CBS 173.52]KIW90223.1 hypothetical protein Z519_08867 [Cladophialophora bantiana CBS 173.52]
MKNGVKGRASSELSIKPSPITSPWLAEKLEQAQQASLESIRNSTYSNMKAIAERRKSFSYGYEQNSICSMPFQIRQLQESVDRPPKGIETADLAEFNAIQPQWDIIDGRSITKERRPTARALGASAERVSPAVLPRIGVVVTTYINVLQEPLIMDFDADSRGKRGNV